MTASSAATTSLSIETPSFTPFDMIEPGQQIALLKATQKNYTEDVEFRKGFKIAKKNWRELREAVLSSEAFEKRFLSKNWKETMAKFSFTPQENAKYERLYKLNIFYKETDSSFLFEEPPHAESRSLTLSDAAAVETHLAMHLLAESIAQRYLKKCTPINHIVTIFQNSYQGNIHFRNEFKAAKKNWRELRDAHINNSKWIAKYLPSTWEQHVTNKEDTPQKASRLKRQYKLIMFSTSAESSQLFETQPFFSKKSSSELPAEVARETILASRSPEEDPDEPSFYNPE